MPANSSSFNIPPGQSRTQVVHGASPDVASAGPSLRSSLATRTGELPVLLFAHSYRDGALYGLDLALLGRADAYLTGPGLIVLLSTRDRDRRIMARWSIECHAAAPRAFFPRAPMPQPFQSGEKRMLLPSRARVPSLSGKFCGNPVVHAYGRWRHLYPKVQRVSSTTPAALVILWLALVWQAACSRQAHGVQVEVRDVAENALREGTRYTGR
ncbi:hypothetical protein K438DRAFT_1774837 [Mycena galopus ATCC 62051]|nr:hypothetical protein K438DRAFT_1774837 [Mycena galopus ATCC 62051]